MYMSGQKRSVAASGSREEGSEIEKRIQQNFKIKTLEENYKTISSEITQMKSEMKDGFERTQTALNGVKNTLSDYLYSNKSLFDRQATLESYEIETRGIVKNVREEIDTKLLELEKQVKANTTFRIKTESNVDLVKFIIGISGLQGLGILLYIIMQLSPI